MNNANDNEFGEEQISAVKGEIICHLIRRHTRPVWPGPVNIR